MNKFLFTFLGLMLSFALSSQLSFERCELASFQSVIDVDHGDLNNDGLTDFVGLSYNNSQVFAYINMSGGYIRLPILDSTEPRNLKMEDMNNDGNLDIVVLDSETNSLKILENDGNLSLNATIHEFSYGMYPTTLKVADINKDGLMDLLIGFGSQERFAHLINEGDFVFTKNEALIPLVGNDFSSAIDVVDINNDGYNDIVIGESFSSLDVYINDGSSLQFDKTVVDSDGGALDLATGDMNGDGLVDIVVCSFQQGLKVHFNSGPAFNKVVLDPNFSVGTALSLSDIDQDDDLDIIVVDEDEQTLYYFENDGGSFTRHTINVGFATGNTTRILDFDGDSDLDILSVNWFTGINVFKNDLLSSTDNLPKQDAINVFPNPFVDQLIIETEEIQNFELLNITGSRIDFDLKTGPNELEDLGVGIYFLRSKDQRFETVKLVKL